MTEVQEACYKMGIPLKTRHREVAPNQYEYAPLFGTATTQIDQNLMVMQVLTEVSMKHGLACLLAEKPFNNVNGSGKHNNWSLGTLCGTNLLNPGQVMKKTGNTLIFPIVMSALIRSIDMHGDLMRMAVAAPGNDFRLGACEAPPAIISTYLGDDITNWLEEFKKGNVTEYVPSTKPLDIGVPSIAPFSVPTEDRNRTSPFPYGGARFEFRAVGSTQNPSIVNTVLATLAADGFRDFADKIEAGAKPADVAAEALNKHWKCIFNGNGYSEEWPVEAVERGVWKIDSGVESMARMEADKNVALFESLNILSREECEARAGIMYDHYSGTVEMEALCMIDMITKQIIPAATSSGFGDVAALTAAAASVKAKLATMHGTEGYAKATIARELRLETMMDAREVCDTAETVIPCDQWPMATYKDLMFLDYTK
jgi:glutamine synthetase